MKAKKKRKNLEEKEKKKEKKEEEKNGGDDQEKPRKAEKPRKIRFLARLQKIWARISGRKRRRTSNQEKRSSEELPGPSNINMVDNTANVSSKEKDVEENPSIKTDDKETVLVTDNFVEKEILAEYQQIFDLIHSMEDLYIQYYGGKNGDHQSGGEENLENQSIQADDKEAVLVTDNFVEKEILAEYQQIFDLIHSMEDLYIQYYGGKNGDHQNGGEENLENQSIQADDKETVLVTDNFVEREILAEYQQIFDLIHSMEDLYIQYYGGKNGDHQNGGKENLENQSIKADDKEAVLVTDNFVEKEILAEYQQIFDLIHSMEDLYIQYYGGKNGDHQNRGEKELESKVGDDGEIKIKEDGEKGLETLEQVKKSQKIPFLARLQESWARIAWLKWRRTSPIKEQSSCEIPGPSHISNTGKKP